MPRTNRYARFYDLIEKRLQAKTSWGRTQVLEEIAKAMLEVADEEIDLYETADDGEEIPWD